MAGPPRVLSSFRHRNYRWVWFAGIGQAIGQGMQMFALTWLTLDLTDGSLSRVGIMIFFQGVPILGLSIFGGVLADRLDRRSVLVAGQLGLMATLFVLATLTIAELVQLWHVYVAAVLVGTGRAFVSPARMALIRDVVERKDVMNAVVLNHVVLNGSLIFSASLAGFIIDRVGMGAALYLDGSFYLMGAVVLLFIRGLHNFRSGEPRATMGRDLVEGLRHVWSSPVILSILVLGFALTFFGSSYGSLLPAFAREVLDLGATKAGFLRSAMGLGAFIGILVLVALGDFRYKNWLWLGAGLLFIVALFVFAITPSFELSLVVLFLVGMGEMTFVSMGGVMLQLLVPRTLQGRVISLWTTVGALMFLGALPMGIVGDVFNLRAAIAGGAVICLIFFLWIGVVKSRVRRLSIQ